MNLDSISEQGLPETKKRYVDLVLSHFVWLMVALVMVCAAMFTPRFFGLPVLMNLLMHSVVLGLLVLAESLCLISGNFDLSVESILVFTAVLAGWLILPAEAAASGLGLPIWSGMLLMLAAGALVGAFNGFLVAYLKMNAFITTLAVSICLGGASVFISSGATLGPLPEEFCLPGAARLGVFPLAAGVLIAAYLLFHFVLNGTAYGRKLYATGGNRNAAAASGVDVRRTVFSVYVVSGLICALAGLLLAGRMGSAASHMTQGNLLYTFAAAVIGGVSPFGGEGRITGILGGVLLLISINKVLALAHVDPFFITLVSGSIILLAMLIITFKEKKYG